MEQAKDDIIKLRTDNVVWRQVADEVVMLDTSRAQYLGVNKTGAALWPLLVEGSSRSALVQALTEHFGIDEATATADTDAFLSSLRELDLLTG